MNHALKLVAQSPLQVQADAAHSHVVELAREVDQKRFDLDKAETTYRESRKPMERLERDCAKDRLQDAESALAAQRDAYAPLFAAADRELKGDELAKLRAQLSPSEFDRHKERIGTEMVETRKTLRGLGVELCDAVKASNALRARARNLAESLGVPSTFPAVTVDGIVAQIDPLPTDYSGRVLSIRCFSPSGTESDRRVIFELNDVVFGADK